MSFRAILLQISALLLALSRPAYADDSEIYLNPNSGGSPPLVMFSIDYRPSVLGEKFCPTTSPGAGCVSADYFRDPNGGNLPASDIPPVMYYLDIIRLSLKVVLNKIAEKNPGVLIGLMMNHQNSAQEANCVGLNPTTKQGNKTVANQCSNGGFILRRFRAVLANDSNGSIAELNSILNELGKTAVAGTGATGHPYQGAELFFEFYRYLNGGPIYNAHNGWEDFASDNKQNINVDFPQHDWDASPKIENGPNYVSPLTDLSKCSKVFTVNLMFQVSQNDASADNDIKAAKPNGMALTLAKNEDRFNQVLRVLRDGSTPVSSYFLAKDPLYKNKTLTGYAVDGGTKAARLLADDPSSIVVEFGNIFSEILSVSTTFVASSVPVNVFNRAEIVDNVFLALFQPNTLPSWIGNLKKLRFYQTLLSDGTYRTDLVDSLTNASSAVETDGRIKQSALTWWSQYSTALMAPGDGNSDGVVNPSVDKGFQTSDQALAEPIVPYRDGRNVFRGGAGQNIPGFKQSPAAAEPGMKNDTTNPKIRRVYFDASSGTSLSDLNVDDTTATALGMTPGPDATDLLAYIRGYDHVDTNGDSILDAYVVRPWLMGAPLHARPLAINYGAIESYSKTRPGIFIAQAANDGVVRLIENTTSGGDTESVSSQSGQEVWAFMPKAVVPAQKLLQKNAPLTADTNPNAGPRITYPAPIPYTMDGTPTVLIKDKKGDGTIDPADDQVILFVGMQRGGRNYYALDITKPRDTPKLLWKIEGGSTGFEELGLTFSEPRVGKVLLGKDYASAVLTDVVIFGGGYDKNKDPKEIGQDDKTGNAIFVVNAKSGELIWKATGTNAGQTASANHFVTDDLLDGIPSNVTAVDTDGDTLETTDRLLVGDTGGNVWRADLLGPDTSKWTLTLLAKLGRHDTTTTKAADRRFFHEPDIVQDLDASGNYDAVIIGSGDRQDPLDRGGPADNYLFMIKDRFIGVGSVPVDYKPRLIGELADVTCVTPPTATTQATPCGAPNLTLGWKLKLDVGGGYSEKALSTPLTFNRIIFFTTYLPAGLTGTSSSTSLQCGPAEGGGNFYAVKLDDATPAFNFNSADGGSTDSPNTADDRSDLLASGGIPAQVVFLPPGEILRPDLDVQKVGSSNRYRTYWRRHEK